MKFSTVAAIGGTAVGIAGLATMLGQRFGRGGNAIALPKGSFVSNFNHPAERRPFVARGHLDIAKLGDRTVGRAVFEPGWRWSLHVKPVAGTQSCQMAHYGYVLAGRMHIEMDDGQTFDIGPGDLVAIEPGHDAWVVGDTACVVLDFAGMTHYAQHAARGAGASATRGTQEPASYGYQPRV